MTLKDLKESLDLYKVGQTERSWKMAPFDLMYENEYVKVVRFDSSNKWISSERMVKQWSIIFELKKDFTTLKTYIELISIYNIKVTKVKKGVNQGCYGIRVYDMKTDPDNMIVKALLDYIFGE